MMAGAVFAEGWLTVVRLVCATGATEGTACDGLTPITLTSAWWALGDIEHLAVTLPNREMRVMYAQRMDALISELALSTVDPEEDLNAR